MQRSKQQALGFLLGALLVGGALGFSADRVMLRDKICPSGKDQSAFRARMFDELDLTTEQRTTIDSLLDDRHRQIRALHAPIRPRLDSISEATWAQMTTIMTAEQRAEFERMRRGWQAERAAAGKARGERR